MILGILGLNVALCLFSCGRAKPEDKRSGVIIAAPFAACTTDVPSPQKLSEIVESGAQNNPQIIRDKFAGHVVNLGKGTPVKINFKKRTDRLYEDPGV
jgi:hypothetical protein